MNVLVAHASKYGATREIAEAIGAVLQERGHEAAVCSVEACGGVEEFGAVVVGGGVYAGHWHKPGADFIKRHAAALSTRPVWLFSSGPIGEPLKPDEEHAVDVSELMRLTGARGHRLFAGKLVKQHLSFPERAITAALRVPEGDFRDWDAIRAWAGEIAADLDDIA